MEVAVYRHVVVAVDLSPNTSVVLRAASEYRKLGARVSVVHVSQGHVTGYGEVTSSHHIANEMQVKQSLYPSLKRYVEDAGLSANEMHLLIGSMAETLHKFVQDQDADLLVMGSHGASAMSSLLGGKVHAVINAADCDVLAVRVYED